MFVETEWRETECDPLESTWALISCTSKSAAVAAVLGGVLIIFTGEILMALSWAAMSFFIHAIAMFVVGLPFFLYSYPRPWLWVWKWQYGIPLGVLLACLPALVWFIAEAGLNWRAREFLGPLLIFGPYGVVSAIVSIHYQSKRS